MIDFNDDIKKYLKGELSPKERHALEQKGLSDPFLADALEGAESVTTGEFLRDLDGLNEKILSKKKQRFTMPWRIAAGVAAIGTTVLLVLLVPQNKSDEMALQKNSETETTGEAPKREEGIKEIKDSIALQPEISYLPPPSPVVTQGPIGSSRLGSGSKPTETKDPLTVIKDSTLIAASDISLEPVDEDLVVNKELDEVAFKKTEKSVAIAEVTDSLQALRTTGSSELAAISTKTANKVTGKVTDQDGAPLPGVNILIKGTNTGTISDINGYYSIELKEQSQSLVYSFVGFESQEKNTDDRDRLDIQLQEDVSQLSEVVVKGRRPPDIEPAGDDNAVVKLAEPLGGRKAYDKYLETAKQYPQQAIERKVEGRVIIEFNVTTTGSLTGFSVLRGLGYGCEEEVIRLVKEGPKWSPSYIDDEAVESLVRVKMRFSLPK